MVPYGDGRRRDRFCKMNDYQWYPGHMTKARRMMEEDIKLVDLVIELLDSRIPYSSRNPDIDKLAKNKSRLVLLNKADLSNPTICEEWVKYFEDKGITAMKLDSRNKSGMKQINEMVAIACKDKIERDRKRGITGRPIRAMVVGIPNVGKSTFINSFAGKAVAKTGNKPGVTKGKQWIRLNKNLELLDTPGILWPKFEDRNVGENIAFIGSMNDQNLVMDELALSLIKRLNKINDGIINEKYPVDEPVKMPEDILLADEDILYLFTIAKSRNALMKGGDYDIEKAAAIVLDDYRSGRLGKFTLERVADYK